MPDTVMPLLEVLHKASAKLHAAYDDVAPGADHWDHAWPVIVLAQQCNPEVVAFVRLMSPALALAVADWLVDEADILAKSWGDEEMGPADREAYEIGYAAPLAVARAILGEVADA